MNDSIYHKVANVLDTLPPGFPSTESGVEIKILKRIFRPDEAELFCSLRMTFESAATISRRTSRPLEGLENKLNQMFSRGQIRRINIGEEKRFCLVPWASGLYELQLDNMDEELAAWIAEYGPSVGLPTLTFKPQIWQSLPIEKEIPGSQTVLPHQQVSAIIENGKEFWARECVCKKVRGLNGTPCKKPIEVCLAIDRFPHIMGENNISSGRKITKEEAYELLDLCEAEGLVHMTHNTESEHNVICNCCGC
ncbi:MAG: 4Fe-4S ferredoxin, partial [Proteobacteria bacterium]|nr:4Fe-4S ferredoxin [Pseudomonadota bacterium]